LSGFTNGHQTIGGCLRNSYGNSGNLFPCSGNPKNKNSITNWCHL